MLGVCSSNFFWYVSVPVKKLDYFAAVAVYINRELLESITFVWLSYSTIPSTYLSQITFRSAQSITSVFRKAAVLTALEFRSLLHLSSGCAFWFRKPEKDAKVSAQQDFFCVTAFYIWICLLWGDLYWLLHSSWLRSVGDELKYNCINIQIYMVALKKKLLKLFWKPGVVGNIHQFLR